MLETLFSAERWPREFGTVRVENLRRRVWTPYSPLGELSHSAGFSYLSTDLHQITPLWCRNASGTFVVRYPLTSASRHPARSAGDTRTMDEGNETKHLRSFVACDKQLADAFQRPQSRLSKVHLDSATTRSLRTNVVLRCCSFPCHRTSYWTP